MSNQSSSNYPAESKKAKSYATEMNKLIKLDKQNNYQYDAGDIYAVAKDLRAIYTTIKSLDRLVCKLNSEDVLQKIKEHDRHAMILLIVVTEGRWVYKCERGFYTGNEDKILLEINPGNIANSLNYKYRFAYPEMNFYLELAGKRMSTKLPFIEDEPFEFSERVYEAKSVLMEYMEIEEKKKIDSFVFYTSNSFFLKVIDEITYIEKNPTMCFFQFYNAIRACDESYFSEYVHSIAIMTSGYWSSIYHPGSRIEFEFSLLKDEIHGDHDYEDTVSLIFQKLSRNWSRDDLAITIKDGDMLIKVDFAKYITDGENYLDKFSSKEQESIKNFFKW